MRATPQQVRMIQSPQARESRSMRHPAPSSRPSSPTPRKAAEALEWSSATDARYGRPVGLMASSTSTTSTRRSPPGRCRPPGQRTLHLRHSYLLVVVDEPCRPHDGRAARRGSLHRPAALRSSRSRRHPPGAGHQRPRSMSSPACISANISSRSAFATSSLTDSRIDPRPARRRKPSSARATPYLPAGAQAHARAGRGSPNPEIHQVVARQEPDGDASSDDVVPDKKEAKVAEDIGDDPPKTCFRAVEPLLCPPAWLTLHAPAQPAGWLRRAPHGPP